jgi:MFS transporter, UMF1 family
MTSEPPQPRPQPPQRLLSNSTKRSLRSHSSSFEADDERSSSADQESMGPGPDVGGPIRPQYVGEDTRLTSRKELAGWYAYAFAAEVFIICGMGQLQLRDTSIWIC